MTDIWKGKRYCYECEEYKKKDMRWRQPDEYDVCPTCYRKHYRGISNL